MVRSTPGRGLHLENDAEDFLNQAIRSAAAGDPVVSPHTTRLLIERFLAPTTAPEIARARQRLANLSDRELHVAHLIGAGKAYKQIAAFLNIAPDTVKSTVTRALQKVGADNGAQLAFLIEQAHMTPGQKTD